MHMLRVLRFADRVGISGLSVIALYCILSTCAIDVVDGETDSMTGSDRLLLSSITLYIEKSYCSRTNG